MGRMLIDRKLCCGEVQWVFRLNQINRLESNFVRSQNVTKSLLKLSCENCGKSVGSNRRRRANVLRPRLVIGCVS